MSLYILFAILLLTPSNYSRNMGWKSSKDLMKWLGMKKDKSKKGFCL